MVGGQLVYVAGSSLKLKFNPEKTQCIRFGRRSSEVCNTFKFCGKSIKCEKAVTHLGHILTENLRDDLKDVVQTSSSELIVLYIVFRSVPLRCCLIFYAATVCPFMVVQYGT